MTGHLLGFTSIDDAGQEGAELAFDNWLAGEDGAKRVIQDSRGRKVEDVESIRIRPCAVPGQRAGACRSKLEYTPLATAFVADEFTISELRTVYETVWGERLHAGNFHRKVLSVPGFVESTGRDHADRRPARRPACAALPPRRRAPAAPGPAAARP